MMSSSIFWRTVVCGFIATFVMTMIAFLQGGVGLPVIDVGHILKESFNEVHGTATYNILWGNTAYYMVGILLALIWVTFFHQNIPGNWAIKGVIYGVVISVLAGLVVAPLVALSAGDPVGIFYTDTWIPGLVMLAGLTMHLGYGLVLLYCLKIAGVEGLISSE